MMDTMMNSKDKKYDLPKNDINVHSFIATHDVPGEQDPKLVLDPVVCLCASDWTGDVGGLCC